MSLKKISIYVRNKEMSPSSYYRILQYTKYFKGFIQTREAAPSGIYKKQLNVDKNKLMEKIFIGSIYYIIMVFRVLYYLILDNVIIPDYVIVSRTFCPKYTPVIIRILIKRIAKKTTLYWDFDDYIFANQEISRSQANILKKYSKKIIVTNEYLKSKIEKEYQSKVILLPTTDGDLQGFEEKTLILKRKKMFKDQIRLVWVGTSANMPNMFKIIKALDRAAEILRNTYKKELILTVVCNKPFRVTVNSLIIRNIFWNRNIAKEEIYNAHIGIMPLILNEYSLGKGGFKLVQYISTGLPVIASNVGFNKQVVDDSCGILVDDEKSDEGWVEAILKICNSEDIWEQYSINAYRKWNEKFSFNHNLQVWNELIRNGE